MRNRFASGTTLLSRVMLVVIPVIVVAGLVIAIGVQQQTISEFVLYLSSQEQFDQFTPRQQVLLSFYADRIAGTLPFAGRSATLTLVDVMANTVSKEMVVTRNDNRFYPSARLREMEARYSVAPGGVLRATLQDPESGRIAQVEITPVLTLVVTPFTPDETQGEDVAHFYTMPTLFEGLGVEERAFLARTTRRVFLYTVATVVVIVALLAVLLARNLRPLRPLVEATRRTRTGGSILRVPEAGPREIRELTRAFNEMSVHLRGSEESRQRMIADVSHELRGPIGNLRAEIEAIQDGILSPEPATIASLHEDVLLLARLVDDLNELALADARALPLVRNEVPAAALITDAVERFRPQYAAAGLRLETDIEDGLPTVHCDHQRIGQAMGNLLANALRYAPAGSTVHISGEVVAGTVVISVCDEGPGVQPDELPYLFDRFYRTDSSRNRSTGGSGLGLAIVRAIVNAHDGSIAAKRNEPSGLCIELTLPA
jgi:two-component system sensor histidine kinase BaeS